MTFEFRVRGKNRSGEDLFWREEKMQNPRNWYRRCYINGGLFPMLKNPTDCPVTAQWLLIQAVLNSSQALGKWLL